MRGSVGGEGEGEGGPVDAQQTASRKTMSPGAGQPYNASGTETGERGVGGVPDLKRLGELGGQ